MTLIWQRKNWVRNSEVLLDVKTSIKYLLKQYWFKLEVTQKNVYMLIHNDDILLSALLENIFNNNHHIQVINNVVWLDNLNLMPKYISDEHSNVSPKVCGHSNFVHIHNPAFKRSFVFCKFDIRVYSSWHNIFIQKTESHSSTTNMTNYKQWNVHAALPKVHSSSNLVS